METTAFQRRAAAVVGTVAAVTAISTTLAPAALATDEWGAIAVSPSASVAGKTWDAPSESAARSSAMSYCGQSDCKVLVTFRSPTNNCGAIAYNNGKYQGGYGASLSAAEQDALNLVGGGTIVSWACND